MEKWAIIICFITAMLIAVIAVLGNAKGAYYCPFQPLIPLGCTGAVCQCDADGNCWWVFVGCE